MIRTVTEYGCCDGVKPLIRSQGGLRPYYVVCPRCHERGPRCRTVVRAMGQWNRMLEHKLSRIRRYGAPRGAEGIISPYGDSPANDLKEIRK